MALTDYVPVQHTWRAVGQGIYQESQNKNCPLGTKLELNDGRIFRYCLNGAGTLAPSKIIQGPVNIATEVNLAEVTVPALGDTKITLTTGSAIAADLYADGYLYMDDDTGEGQIYKIKSHPATSGAASCVFTLYDSVRVACDANTTYGLVKNPYSGVIIQVASGSTQTSRTVGVPLIPVTAAYFFWAQTWGDGLGWIATNTALGKALMNHTTAGQVTQADGTLPILGSLSGAIGIASDEYKPVFWTIAP